MRQIGESFFSLRRSTEPAFCLENGWYMSNLGFSVKSDLFLGFVIVMNHLVPVYFASLFTIGAPQMRSSSFTLS